MSIPGVASAGHAQSLPRAMDTMALCPSPGARNGHVRWNGLAARPGRERREFAEGSAGPAAADMSIPGARERGKCSVLAASDGHNGTMSIPGRVGRACPVKREDKPGPARIKRICGRAAGPSSGHVHSWGPRARDMLSPCREQWTQWHYVHPRARGEGMSGGTGKSARGGQVQRGRDNPRGPRQRTPCMKKPSLQNTARQPRNRRGGAPALAALAGVVAAGVVLSVAELIGAFFTARATPLIALGSTFIDFTPPWLKDFAIATFGTNDKAALFVGMGGDHSASRLCAGRGGLPQVGAGGGRGAADGGRDRGQCGDPGQRQAARRGSLRCWAPSPG